MNYQAILDFWFAQEHQALWYAKQAHFDQLIREHFLQLHAQAAQAELWTWRQHAQGRLAEIIVLDQFSRNMYRDQPNAFTQDVLALALAQEAVSLQLDQQLPPAQRAFLYMPFMHSESRLIHQHALHLFQQLAEPIALDFEIRHKNIIDRFGRYPHRNAILGRVSTPQELQFLQQPGSSF